MTPGVAAAVKPLRVLIADDQPDMRWMIRRALSASHEFDVVGEAANGREGLVAVQRLRPDVVLVDLAMPILDGVGMIRELKALDVHTRCLVLTGNVDRESVARAIAAGADGYVVKGATADEIRAATRDVSRGGAVLTPTVARWVFEEYTQMMEEKRGRDLAVIRTLASAVEARDQVTGDHANNVARLSLRLWRSMMGSDPSDDLVYGFLLHDVGKIAIPDAVLRKPGALTPVEIEIMRTHVDVGVRLVDPLGFRSEVTDVIRCHHERWDGAGYPNGLRGEQIPLHARVFSVVDAYDAMTSDRPYRAGMKPEDALQELSRFAGTQFDPACVSAFQGLAAELSVCGATSSPS